MVSGSPQSTIGRFVGYISCSYKRIFIIVALYLVASVLLLAAQPSARQDPRSASLSKITKQWSVPPNHHIIISSSWLDPHNKLESLRKLTSDLIVLASRTNRFAYYLRKLVIPFVLDGQIVAPGVPAQIDRARDGANPSRPTPHPIIPDYFQLAENSPLSKHIASFGDFISRNPTWRATELQLLCLGRLCGPRFHQMECNSSFLASELQVPGSQWSLESRQCITMRDEHPEDLESLLNSEELSNKDVVLSSWNPSVLWAGNPDSSPPPRILATSTPIRAKAEQFAREMLRGNFAALYWPHGWSLSIDSDMIVANALAWARSVAMRTKTVVFLSSATRQRGADVFYDTNGVSAQIYDAMLELSDRLEREIGLTIRRGAPSHVGDGFVDFGELELLYTELLLLPSCVSFQSVNMEEPWSLMVLQARGERENEQRLLFPPLNPIASSSKSQHSDIAFFVPTMRDNFPTKISTQLDTWLAGLEDHVFFLTESSFDGIDDHLRRRLPNVIDTGCANSKPRGIWCRHDFLFKYINKYRSRFEKYKWIARIDDESYIHTENLRQFLETLSFQEQQIVGEVYCHQDGFRFVSGGPGYALSRSAALDRFDFAEWSRGPVQTHLNFVDDVLTGHYCSRVPGCNVVHHHGFSYAPALAPFTSIYEWYLSKNGTWDLPYKPIAFHQTWNMWGHAKRLHRELHSLIYGPSSQQINMTVLEECKCFPGHFSRCALNEKLAHTRYCETAAGIPACITG